MTVEVTHNDGAARYEVSVDGTIAGFAAYRLTDQVVVFTHTEVLPAFEGQGIGSALALAALDDVRDGGERRVLALCSFISDWIGKHPDYQSLVDSAPRSTATD